MCRCAVVSLATARTRKTCSRLLSSTTSSAWVFQPLRCLLSMLTLGCVLKQAHRGAGAIHSGGCHHRSAEDQGQHSSVSHGAGGRRVAHASLTETRTFCSYSASASNSQSSSSDSSAASTGAAPAPAPAPAPALAAAAVAEPAPSPPSCSHSSCSCAALLGAGAPPLGAAASALSSCHSSLVAR